MVVRAHLEESASGLRARCSLRTMKPSICVIGTLGGIKVSLHWGGRFGVRESEELISGRTSGGSENNDSGSLTSLSTLATGQPLCGTGTLSGPHPTPWSPMCVPILLRRTRYYYY